MVLARGFQWKVTKKDVMDFFKGINILNGENGINIMKNTAMEAYVELGSKTDVKKALALNSKRVDARTVHGKSKNVVLEVCVVIITVSFIVFLSRIVTEIDSKEYSRVASCISKTNDSNVVQIRGLPWSVDKAYIMKLFPSECGYFGFVFYCKIFYVTQSTFSAIKIPKNHIQIEVDENNRRTGYGFVEFDTAEQYESAFKTDFRPINQWVIWQFFQTTKV